MKYDEALSRVRDRLAKNENPTEAELLIDPPTRTLFEQAIEEWRRLISKYPSSDDATRAAIMATFADAHGQSASLTQDVTGSSPVAPAT